MSVVVATNSHRGVTPLAPTPLKTYVPVCSDNIDNDDARASSTFTDSLGIAGRTGKTGMTGP